MFSCISVTLLDKLKENIRSAQLLHPYDRLLIGVSGGVDSICLAHLLWRLNREQPLELVIAHFNHQLRGVAADQDEAFVKAFAANLGTGFVSGRGDVRSTAEASGISVEMAARKLRHHFLASTAQLRGCQHVALAHHADDQAELFFLRLLRGRAGAGLAGMKWSSPSPENPRINLIRPLLNITKQQLIAYAAEHGLQWREDRSNTDLSHERNKIRQKLLPCLRAEFGDPVDLNILRVMEVLGAEKDLVHQLASTWLKQRTDFSQLHASVQREVLHLQLLQAGLTPEFEMIEHLRTCPEDPLTIAPGQHLSRNVHGELKISADPSMEFSSERLEIDLTKSKNVCFGDALLEWSFQAAKSEKEEGEEQFDADTVGERITLRYWQPGDRFQPIGMGQPVKLQDLFTNAQIPPKQRRLALIATTSSGQIFWVEGLRIAETFKITPRTSRFLRWSAKPLSPHSS